MTARVQEPEKLIPHLFDEIDPTLKKRVKQGDFIVAGQHLFCGKAHNQGMIAMKALGLRVLRESMPFRSFRAATGVALPCLIHCEGISKRLKTGDEIEADSDTGTVTNLRNGQSRIYPGIPQRLSQS